VGTWSASMYSSPGRRCPSFFFDMLAERPLSSRTDTPGAEAAGAFDFNVLQH